MRRALRTNALVALVLLPISTSGQASPEPGPRCAATSAVGPCFRVHGRLFAANGAPTFRIWVVGTRRILGVHGDDAEAGRPTGYPACLVPHIGFDKNLYADFTVCPVAPDRPGRMRPVCIESASNLVSEEAGAAGDRQRVRKIEGTCTDPR